MIYAIEKNLTAVSLTDALLFQGQQCNSTNSIGAVKLTAVRFFSIGYIMSLCYFNLIFKRKIKTKIKRII
jgi:hypothetical protein